MIKYVTGRRHRTAVIYVSISTCSYPLFACIVKILWILRDSRCIRPDMVLDMSSDLLRRLSGGSQRRSIKCLFLQKPKKLAHSIPSVWAL